MSESGRFEFDWETVKRRLAPGVSYETTQEELSAVFHERAVALAKRPTKSGAGAGTPHLGFRVADVHFAIAVADVKTCLSPSWVTTIPCAPTHLSDVIHVQGRIISVVDLGVLFGLGAAQARERDARVILVEALGRTVGVWAAQLDGIVSLDQSALDTTRTQGSRGAEFLRGITADMTLVLAATELVKRAKNGATDSSR